MKEAKNKIVIVGLGSGDEDALPLGTLKLFKQHTSIWLRTEKHPVVSWLRNEGVSFQTFDSVYQNHSNFAAVYREIADRLFQIAEKEPILIYAVPGHPMVAEKAVQILLAEGEQQGIEIEVRGGGSFLDTAFARLGFDPIEGFQLVDASELHGDRIDPRVHILVGQVYDRLVASELKLSLMDAYPEDHPIQLATGLGVPTLERIESLPLYELDHRDDFTDLTSVYVPPVQQEQDLYGRFDFLTQVIAHLRSPEGCPWDRKQTHESLRPYLIEETYEFLEAVADQDVEAMADELGDVLLQVMLHSQIASEEGTFDIYEVIERLTDKMIRRHPHVFGDQVAETAEDVKQKWEQIKKKERSDQAISPSSELDQIPKGLPAILKAYELSKKAAKMGFDWDRTEEVVEKVEEELQELMAAQTDEEREDELGDLLFVLIGSLSRFMKVHPELALIRSIRKFEGRFRYVEEQAMQSGRSFNDYSMEKLDTWWNEAKKLEAESDD
ncbi:nucleoside triphosphate pyrophosphohydrolase [Hazenella coriacea]|uniref:Tetrapyrrole methylase family protein/MazG family protein n=1 Tax=Hazenella coriacea TaxID=1179467 RepID=A0A4R3L410_9BACL|nr:nucleoside triphosphate pyrophosphohydrolase [Hazenella coriacea]TCS94289.1 tetrapyrrole methylase family protein/MazG family protein [Hazenella coriacea]